MRAYAFFSLLAATLLAAAPLAFGQNTWQPLAGPKGISVLALASADDGKTYIVTTYSGIFRTSDDGETWTPFNTGTTDNSYGYDATFATAPGGKVYFCNTNELYRLSSSGNAWEELSLPLNYSADLVFTNQQGDVFAVETFGGIYRSTNGGNSFSLFVPDAAMEGWPGVYAFHGNGHNFASVAYGASGRIYRISDDGSQVVQVNSISATARGLVYHEPSGRVFYSDGSNFKYSENDGTSWQAVTIIPGAPSQPYIYGLIVQPSGELIAASNIGSFVSQDGGNTWTMLSSPLGDMGSQLEMAFAPGATYAATADCGNQSFIRTTDNWATWENLEEKFSAPIVYSLFKDPTGNLYAQTCNSSGLERSSDGGNTWQPFLLPNGQPAMQITKNNFGHLFAFTSDSLFRSTNAGTNWVNVTPNTFLFYGGLLSVSPQNELYLYSDFEAFKSLNNGDTWELVSFPQVSSPTGIAVHPDGSFYVASDFSGIWRSNDGWQTWEQVLVADADIYSLHINTKGHIYFYMDDFINNIFGFFVSYDNLNSYQLVDPNIFPSSVVSDAEGDVYILDYSGILFSEDDGMSWQQMNDGLPDPQRVSALYIDDEQYLYASQYGDVIYKTALPLAEKNTVRGKIWFDENENCQFDPGEQPLTGWLVKAVGGGDDFYRSTGYDGNYVLGLPPGDFSAKPVLPNTLWENECSPQGVNISFSDSGDTAFVDFPIAAAQLCPLLTVDISTPLLRRCFENTYTVKTCNEGTAEATNATVEVTLDSLLIFQSATAPLLSQNGNIYAFSVGNIGVGDCKTFQIVVKVSCEAELGQTHCVEARLPQAPCSAFPPSVTKECQQNIGSFDPNDKTALVSGLPEYEWLNPDTDIEYHIRFQNTGTDTAFTIVVEDQLSTWLDPATVRPGVSSHPYTFEMTETGMLRFVFTNIMLPDSNINEAASHGFVKFAVSQRSGVPFGSYINNFAPIFFDFNEPVLTNTISLHVGNPTATVERKQRYTVLAYPNPFENVTHLKIVGLDGQQLQLRLFDARGILLRQEPFVAPEVALQRDGLTSGMYFFSIEKDGEIVGSGKLIVK